MWTMITTRTEARIGMEKKQSLAQSRAVRDGVDGI